ncbi:MAG: hypothetical protein ACFFCO_11995 [Promethearchaeota archaeon]
MANPIRVSVIRALISISFIIWGIFWFLFGFNFFGELLGGFFMIVGAIFLGYSVRELLRYRRTGEVKRRWDERAALNQLKAARRGFEFLLLVIAVLLILYALQLISDALFVVFTGFVFGIGVAIYLGSYYWYEGRA